MRIKKCENCKWWQGELREYDDLGKFKRCYQDKIHPSIISINSNDSCDKFEFNHMKKKTKKTKLKKVPAMTTKKGAKLYISSIKERIDETLRSETSYMKKMQSDLKRIKRRKSLNSFEKLRVEYLSTETKKSGAIIAEAKRHKKELTPEMVEKDLKKLRKHPHIVGVEAGTRGFQVYTKPLKVRKRKIGYYEIELSYKNPGSIYISNLYKKISDGRLDHWFIENRKPCLGNWKKGLREYLYSGNIYLAVDSLVRFLTSSYHSKKGYRTFSEFIRNY